jgi:hypothetical protein
VVLSQVLVVCVWWGGGGGRIGLLWGAPLSMWSYFIAMIACIVGSDWQLGIVQAQGTE